MNIWTKVYKSSLSNWTTFVDVGWFIEVENKLGDIGC